MNVFRNTQQAALVHCIEQHGFRAVPLDSVSSPVRGARILAEEQLADSGDGWVDSAHELYGPYWTVRESTPSAVRDWLGY